MPQEPAKNRQWTEADWARAGFGPASAAPGAAPRSNWFQENAPGKNDLYVELPNGTYVHVPASATPAQLNALRSKLATMYPRHARAARQAAKASDEGDWVTVSGGPDQGDWVTVSGGPAARQQSPKGDWFAQNAPNTVPIPKGATIGPPVGTLTFKQATAAPKMTAAQAYRALANQYLPAAAPYAGALGAASDFLKSVASGIGGEVIGQGQRLADYLSPAHASQINALLAPYSQARPGIGEGLGRFGLQAGEFAALPEGPEWGGLLGRLARIGTQGLGSAGVTALQGGSPYWGGAMGAFTGGLGEMARASERPLMGAGLGIRGKQEAFGKNPIGAAIRETTGTTPDAILAESKAKIGSLMGDIRSRIGEEGDPLVDLGPVKNRVANEWIKAAHNNQAERAKVWSDVMDRLSRDVTGQPIPDRVPASRAMGIKQAVQDLIRGGGRGAGQGGWDPYVTHGVWPFTRQVPHAIGDAIDEQVPGTAGLNRKIADLLEVRDAAQRASMQPGLIRGLIGRATAKSGAMLPALMGGMGEFEMVPGGGPLGATIGGGLGMVAPEVIALPRTAITAARLAGSPTVRAIPRALLGPAVSALTATHESPYPGGRFPIRTAIGNSLLGQ